VWKIESTHVCACMSYTGHEGTKTPENIVLITAGPSTALPELLEAISEKGV